MYVSKEMDQDSFDPCIATYMIYCASALGWINMVGKSWSFPTAGWKLAKSIVNMWKIYGLRAEDRLISVCKPYFIASKCG
jgi:hypothetical protein